MPMDRPAVDAFHITGSAEPVPQAERVLYADGSADGSMRPGTDLELSHWVPTTTPERWTADTSTEICMRFCADPPDERYGLAVNNHLDVDGVLSLFTLARSPVAVAHRDVVVGAAEMGDFNAAAAAADRPAFRLAQELTLMIGEAQAAGWDLVKAYATGFDLAEAVLAGEHPEPEVVTAAWETEQQGHERIGSGEVAVVPVSDRLVSFTLPPLDGEELAAALTVPPFNSVIDRSVWLWPHTRNREHGERVQLVSVPSAGGWFHDLWLPGYSWAHTPDRWTPPGLVSTGDSNVWQVDSPPLAAAVSKLRARERHPGGWALAEQLTPFTSLAGRAFPVVVSFVDAEGSPAVSSVPPDLVATVLAPAF